jgi:hypothetical protein
MPGGKGEGDFVRCLAREQGLGGKQQARCCRGAAFLQPPAKMPARAQHPPHQRADGAPVAAADEAARAEELIGHGIGRARVGLDEAQKVNGGGKLSGGSHNRAIAASGQGAKGSLV